MAPTEDQTLPEIDSRMPLFSLGGPAVLERPSVVRNEMDEDELDDDDDDDDDLDDDFDDDDDDLDDDDDDDLDDDDEEEV